MQFTKTRLLIFAKEPQVGRVKTRLIPALGAEGACRFHIDCLQHAVDTRCSEQLASVSLLVTPPEPQLYCQALAKQYSIELQTQEGEDLGERMANAAKEALESAEYVVLTGSDAPALTKPAIADAIQQLVDGHDVVMIPAEDGGYVLLGLRRFIPELFSAIPWGTGEVTAITRKRCETLQLKLYESPILWDIDRPEDLKRLVELNGDWSQHLPRL